MTIQHWRAFVAVCECNSITAAANQLFMAQPAVSRIIIELEQYYNIRLFDRVNNRLRITSTGQAILGYARDLVNQYDRMEDAIRGMDVHSTIKAGSSLTFGLYMMSDCLKAFNQEYPEVTVNLTIDLSSVLIQKVLSGEVDIAFVERRPEAKELQVNALPGDQVLFFCQKDCSIAPNGIMSIEDLQQENICLKKKGHSSRDVFDATLLSKYGTTVSPIFESINARALISHVVNMGNMIGALAYWQLKESLDKGDIRIIMVDGLEIRRNYYCISRKNRKLDPKEQQFVNDSCKVFTDFHKQMNRNLKTVL